MFISEMIVGFWFVPVVLFILIPLSTLCLWSVHKGLRAVIDKIEQVHKAAENERGNSFVKSVRPRHAV